MVEPAISTTSFAWAFRCFAGIGRHEILSAVGSSSRMVSLTRLDKWRFIAGTLWSATKTELWLFRAKLLRRYSECPKKWLEPRTSSERRFSEAFIPWKRTGNMAASKLGRIEVSLSG